jgi:hypothetical protein
MVTGGGGDDQPQVMRDLRRRLQSEIIEISMITLVADQSIDTATLIEASTADFSMYPTAFGLAATAFFTAAESRNCFGGTPLPVNRIRDQIALTCALSRPVTFL